MNILNKLIWNRKQTITKLRTKISRDCKVWEETKCDPILSCFLEGEWKQILRSYPKLEINNSFNFWTRWHPLPTALVITIKRTPLDPHHFKIKIVLNGRKYMGDNKYQNQLVKHHRTENCLHVWLVRLKVVKGINILSKSSIDNRY